MFFFYAMSCRIQYGNRYAKTRTRWLYEFHSCARWCAFFFATIQQMLFWRVFHEQMEKIAGTWQHSFHYPIDLLGFVFTRTTAAFRFCEGLDALSRFPKPLPHWCWAFSSVNCCVCHVAVLVVKTDDNWVLIITNFFNFTFPTFSIYLIILSIVIQLCSSIYFDSTIQWDVINAKHQSPVERETAYTQERLDKEKRSSCSLCKIKQST